MRSQESIINEANTFQTLDIERIRQLLENSFGKMLSLDYFKQPTRRIFFEPDYKAIAIIHDIDGVAYLDKFAVAKEHEGAGLGKHLWQKVTQEFPSLIWRANPENSFNSFYQKESSGSEQYPDWIVYWRELDPEKIKQVIQKVRTKSMTLT